MRIKTTIVTTIICTLMLSINVQAGQFIKPYGDVPSVEVQNLNMAYEKLPQRTRDFVEIHGYSLYLADDSIYDVVDPSIPHTFNGFTSESPAVVMVKYNARNATSDAVLYHEIGHAINNILGRYSDSGTWQYVYETEFRPGLTFSKIDNRSEWFAESVFMYYMYPAYFKTYCPLSYSTISEVLSAI